MALQNALAKSVERGDPQVHIAIRQNFIHALLHLIRGLVGESERQNLVRLDVPLHDEPGEPARDDSGFAGSSSGNNQKRTLWMNYGRLLLWVEVFEDVLIRHSVLPLIH